MYELQSILNNSTVVVVFFPFLFLLLISPSSVILSLKILFIKVDLPTPEFPENAVILFFKISSTTFIFSPIFAFVFIFSAFSIIAFTSLTVYLKVINPA